ncbi:hypothetical protein Afil01_39900 [Actinorhabdospora filicis]|uniref:Uncharacterized protein n=1 Tax=Actinorhabdospora filicis TaxID=1785913 RepID=A0A9W6SNF7_9ACTN|nr:hypothetical protein Afil01_39900 [Actinorhabdospora filicis]
MSDGTGGPDVAGLTAVPINPGSGSRATDPGGRAMSDGTGGPDVAGLTAVPINPGSGSRATEPRAGHE